MEGLHGMTTLTTGTPHAVDGREERCRDTTLFRAEGITYNGTERALIQRIPLIHTANDYLALHRFDDDRDNERYAADAQRYPWLVTDTQQSAA